MDDKGALTRGIGVLRLLSEKGALSLEELVRATAFPKTSLFRVMRELVLLGVVARDPDRRFRALQRLMPAAGSADFDALLRNVMTDLARQTGQTIEWYLPGPEGMVLTQRETPDGAEIGVRANVGFVRKWRGEMDAVLALGTAWLLPKEKRPPLASYTTYVRPYKPQKMSAQAVRERLAEATRSRKLADETPNANNVRRAAALVTGLAGALGVLAAAEVVHPAEGDRIRRLSDLVFAAAEKISNAGRVETRCGEATP
jgi:DNA-binding IclR family transcriptional regulator